MYTTDIGLNGTNVNQVVDTHSFLLNETRTLMNVRPV